jgi:hypothetical protein
MKEPRKLDKALTVAAGKLPAVNVGQGYSLSFWLYLTDFQPTTNGKILIARSPASTIAGNLDLTNPVVFLDRSTNKMHFCVKTTRAPENPSVTLDDLMRTSSGNRAYLVASVEYVPMQRWSMFTLTVQDSTMTVFQDGSIYTVKSLFDMVDTKSSTPRPMFAAVNGDMTIGGPSTDVSDAANGFIARVKAFNYALAVHQVQNIYTGGPTSSNPLRGLGIPAYGVRNPIYKVDDE